ncbi:hypothetical protein JXO52_01570 [bacterium]|nr:hypothetical protein [bacterium]
MQNIPGALLLTALLLSTACQKQSTAPDINDTTPEISLPGEYVSAGAALTITVTTDSPQEANDLFSPGSGGIVISGAHETVLRYLVPIDDASSEILLATDDLPLISLLELFYPAYRLTLVDLLGFIKIATFTVKTSRTDSTNYYGSHSRFSYNEGTRTLTADSVYFYTSDSSAFVIFDGTLASPAITIPANTPTTVMTAASPAPGMFQLSLAPDSAFSLAVALDGLGDSLSGRWEAYDPDRLAFVYVPDQGRASDTLFAAYTLGAYGLTLTIDEDAAPYLAVAELEEMVPLLETALGLASGSLDNLHLRAAVTFTKQTAKPAVPAHGRPDLLSSPGVRDGMRYLALMGREARRLAGWE